jgi:hypothetical protein
MSTILKYHLLYDRFTEGIENMNTDITNTISPIRQDDIYYPQYNYCIIAVISAWYRPWHWYAIIAISIFGLLGHFMVVVVLTRQTVCQPTNQVSASF